MRSDRALLSLAAASAVGILAVLAAAYWLKLNNPSTESAPLVVAPTEVQVTAGLASMLQPGWRAITLPVSNEVAGVAGFVLPGDYVDVMLNSRDDAGHPTSIRVLQRVRVLAVDQERSIKDQAQIKVGKELTLEVNPQQAQEADTARAMGALTFVLRGLEDDRVLDTEMPAKKNEPPRKLLPPLVSQKTNPSGVEVIRGTTRTLETGIAP